MAQPGASPASEIRRLIPEIRGIVGDDRRVLVGFDRGGWSPALFADMIAARGRRAELAQDTGPGCRRITVPTPTHIDEHGATRIYDLPDTSVRIPLDDADPDAGTVTLRQVSKLDPVTGRQVHILTSRTDLTPAQVCFPDGRPLAGGELLPLRPDAFRVGLARRTTATPITDDDPGRSVPNPAKKTAHRAVQAARAGLARAETRRDE